MQLKCKINNIEYDCNLVQGVPFSEEYTEILDGASIIIAHIDKIENLLPYDDVYIYDGSFNFNGFNEDGCLVDEQGIPYDKNHIKFYKHFLVDKFEEQKIRVNENTKYNYTIQLFSELKGLETVQLPNISITQPLNINKKISVYQYMKQYIDMYSPKIKVAIDENKWEYKNKYKLSKTVVDYFFENITMESVFGNIYSPDFTLNNPNLKDVLSQLMITKDRIPYVYNNVIYALDITKRREKPFDTTKGELSIITSARSSENHCDNLKRTYSNALGQNNTCKMVEYLGFRNSDETLMTIENMRLETRYPIYKINKVYLCYYKKGFLKDLQNNLIEGENKVFLCKQDITQLVKLNSERNLLSQDWDDFENNKPTSIEELSKYKLGTVGYDIGSNYITGWGTKYSYPVGWWDKTKTYLENIFNVVDKSKPYGIYSYGYVTKEILGTDKIFAFASSSDDNSLNNVASPFSNNSLKLKSFFFMVEYDGFYNGTVIHTKDGATGDITMNDNPSSSLTLLEQDGLAQKEKINRFGNAAITISARYKNIEDLQPLGSVIGDDVIIYHREYSIFENYILCTYYGMKDYVLKNYFTSVYAKHRPYNLMSYEESVTRAENKKVMFYLSKDNQYYEKNENSFLKFQNFENSFYLDKIFSAFNPTNEPRTIGDIINKDKINYAFITANSPNYDQDGNIIDYSEKEYSSDINSFVSGYSLCFNSKMYDNVSSGVYIKKSEPFNDDKYEDNDEYNGGYMTWLIDPKSVYSGSLQTWHMTLDDIETGFLKNITFYVSHIDQTENYLDKVLDYSNENELKNIMAEIYNDKLFKMPLMVLDNGTKSNLIGNTFEINKDNKEVIDMTFQLEPITDNDDIMFSPWLMKLSDLYGNYNKFEYTFDIIDAEYNSSQFQMITTTLENFNRIGSTINMTSKPMMVLSINKGSADKIEENMLMNNTFVFDVKTKYFDNFEGDFSYYSYTPKKIKSIKFNDDNVLEEIVLVGSQLVKYKRPFWGKEKDYYLNDVIVTFKNMELSGDWHPSWPRVPEDKYYLSNCFFEIEIEEKPVGTYQEIWAYYNDNNNAIVYTKKGASFDSGYFGNGKYFDVYNVGSGSNDLFTEKNANFQDLMIMKSSGELIPNENIKTYNKNMFVLLSPTKLKKTLVYDEYKANELTFSELNVQDVFNIEIDSDFNQPYINVNLQDVDENTQSIQYWFFDEASQSYKFVFGVNIEKDDVIQGRIKIYISELSTLNKKVYDEKYNLIGETQDFVYNSNVSFLDENKNNVEVIDNYIQIKLPLSLVELFANNDKENIYQNISVTLSYFTDSSTQIPVTETLNYILEYDGSIILKPLEETSNMYIPTLRFSEKDNSLISNLAKDVYPSFNFNYFNVRVYDGNLYGTGQYYTKK